MSTSIDNEEDELDLYENKEDEKNFKWNEPNPRYGGTDISNTKYLDSIKLEFYGKGFR